MKKTLTKALMALLLVAGGVVVIADLLGTGKAEQYAFNFFFFTILLPAIVGLWFKIDGQFAGISNR